LAVWNDAEAPEPPANLTATLKGAVIHRFCETYTSQDSAEDLLRQSFSDVLRLRQAELGERMQEINADAAVADLLPLAQNYLASPLLGRIERARATLSLPPGLAGAALAVGVSASGPSSLRTEHGLWSELSFRLRRPLGILSGAIDKLLLTPGANGKGFVVEVIDFKTNRLRPRPGASTASAEPRPHTIDDNAPLNLANEQLPARRPRSQQQSTQLPFDFSATFVELANGVETESSLADQVRLAATDYQLQMQAYVLAVSELMPGLPPESTIISTLHFLEPNVEFHLAEDLVAPETCRRAIDEALREIASSTTPRQFPVRTAAHCRMCNFLGICPAGQDWVRSLKDQPRWRTAGALDR
jgi:hypothetical protein